MRMTPVVRRAPVTKTGNRVEDEGLGRGRPLVGQLRAVDLRGHEGGDVVVALHPADLDAFRLPLRAEPMSFDDPHVLQRHLERTIEVQAAVGVVQRHVDLRDIAGRLRTADEGHGLLGGDVDRDGVPHVHVVHRLPVGEHLVEVDVRQALLADAACVDLSTEQHLPVGHIANVRDASHLGSGELDVRFFLGGIGELDQLLRSLLGARDGGEDIVCDLAGLHVPDRGERLDHVSDLPIAERGDARRHLHELELPDLRGVWTHLAERGDEAVTGVGDVQVLLGPHVHRPRQHADLVLVVLLVELE